MDSWKRWRAGKRAAVAAAVVTLLFVAAAVIAPPITVPLPQSERLIPLLTGASGFSLQAERVTWTPWNRITLHGVTGYAQGEADFGEDGPSALTVERAELDVSWADVLPWQEPPSDRLVVVRGGDLHFSSALQALPDFESAAALEALRPWLGDEMPTVEEARVRLAGDYVALEGVRLRSGRGTAELDVRVEGDGPDRHVAWRVRTDGWRWDGPPWNDVPYHIRNAWAEGVWNASDGLTVEHLTAELVAGGRTRYVEARGAAAPDGPVAFEVEAADVRLPDDLPQLAPWSVAGTAHFAGTVTGSSDALRLDGTVTMGPGTLWGQTVDFAQADIALTPEQLTVAQSQIRKGASRYGLAGTWEFPTASPAHHRAAADDPFRGRGALDLTLTTEAGRAETLLEVLGWSTWPLTGKVDGVLRFRGPVGSLESEGRVTVAEGRGWNQPFDEISAAYHWDREALQLTDGVFRLGGGRGEFTGRIGADGALDVAIDSTGFPLEGLEAARQAGLDTLQGRIGFQGRVQGTLADPQWEGRVHGTALAMGGLAFERGGGELAQSRGMWEVRSLVLERASGARYTVSGWVDTSPDEAPLVHLLVDVDGERLEEALALMGVRLAYPLASGRVAGRSLLVGELSRPDGEVVLDVTEAMLAGRPTGLSVELDVAGGQVKVRHLRLGEGEPAVRQDQSRG